MLFTQQDNFLLTAKIFFHANKKTPQQISLPQQNYQLHKYQQNFFFAQTKSYSHSTRNSSIFCYFK